MSPDVGCNVIERVTLRRERVLPVCGDVLVRRGDPVVPQTVIAKAETVPGQPYLVDAFAALGARPDAEAFGKMLRVRVGDHVTPGQIMVEYRPRRFAEPRLVRAPVDGIVEFIARSLGRLLVRENPRLAKPFINVNVAGELIIPPHLLRTAMRLKPGDEVRQGMVLAAVPDTFRGMRCSYAPASGIISAVCLKSGRVTILRPSRPTAVTAYLGGHIERVVPEFGAVVKGEAARIEGVFGIGFENTGQLRRLVDGPEDELDARDIDANCRGKIIVGGSYVGLEALRRALAVGATGVICGGVDQIDLVSLVGRELNTAQTGQEDIALSIVITEGFGHFPMDRRAFALLGAHEGEVASLNGTTQVRAGAIRPEVIISLPAEI